ncbi:MAG TPA: hypothetical protein PL096_06070 [Micropepsaceae bacterium]|nr:hypothetical protein [Micropepsaceae bacterium]
MLTSVDRTSQVDVLTHIRNASAETGTDFDYLVRTAMRESSLNPEASASTSSARGLFQFIEQTWLAMVKNHGAEHGLSDYADAITKKANGRYVVADPAVREEILALRTDPAIASVMAAELTAESRNFLEGRLNREVTGAELYIAHFLGPQGAANLIEAAAKGEPDASKLFPAAADANRSIFFNRDGSARSAADVYANLVAKHDATAPVDLPPALASRFAALSGEGAPQPILDKALQVMQMRPLDGLQVTDPADGKVGRAYQPAYSDWAASDRVFQAPADQPMLITPFVAHLLATLDPLGELDPDLASARSERQQERRRNEAAV